MMVADVSELGLVGANELEDDAIGSVYPEAPYLMMFRVQFLRAKRGMKGIVLEQFGLGGGFMLDGLGEFFEETIERGGSRKSRSLPAYSISSCNDLRFVTRPARWSRSEASSSFRNSFLYRPIASQKASKFSRVISIRMRFFAFLDRKSVV